MVLREERPLPAGIAALYPFPRRYVEVAPGVRMHYAELGNGPPVVFLHGNPTWSFLWRRFLPPLAERGFRAIAPDHVGFGLSDKPLDQGYYSPERHVENLGRFLDALKLDRFTLAVHDWGGPIGLAWAVRNPERIERLAIFNTLAFAPKRRRALSSFHLVFGSPLGGLLARHNVLLEVAMRFGVAERSRMRGEVLRGYRFPFDDPRSRIAPLAFVRMVPNGPGHPTAPFLRELEAGLPRLADKPAVVLWGDADPVFPKRHAERWPQALPGVRDVKHHAGGGHFLQEDVPEALVADLLGFLGT